MRSISWNEGGEREEIREMEEERILRDREKMKER